MYSNPHKRVLFSNRKEKKLEKFVFNTDVLENSMVSERGHKTSFMNVQKRQAYYQKVEH